MLILLVRIFEPENRTPLFLKMLYKPPRSIASSTQSQRRTDLMTVERTFSIIKPDATSRSLTGAINAMIEQAGLRIVAQKRVRITREQAQAFYAVHSARPFFGELVDFMISGPVVVQVLEGENAIAKYRDVMGATDPAKAAPGTIRKVHAVSIGENSVHGSDAPDTAAEEIAQFFSGNEIVG
jgi:nucleoside-diphosphate kinase